MLQNVGKLSMCGGTFHIKMFLIHSPWCHHSFTSHFFSINARKMVGLFIPFPHGDGKLACTMCDNALKNWSVFKTLQCFKILNFFQNTSVFQYLVTLSARKWLLFCGFLKLSSPLNALSHMVQAYKCSSGESLILHWTNFVSVSSSASIHSNSIDRHHLHWLDYCKFE